MAKLIEELRRRNVFRIAALYLVAGWLVLQVADVLAGVLGLPDWTLRFVAFLLLLGFPLALVFSWVYELTPEGIKRESEIDRSESATGHTSRKLGVATVALLAAAVTLLALDRFVGVPDVAQPIDTPAEPVAANEYSTPVPKEAAAAAAKGNRRSVAVLPFANRSTREEDQFFADGMHDDLLTQLAKIGSLKVISRTSVMEYRETTKKIPQIAAELGVATVLEGGVQRAGQRVRINVQLIDAGTDEHLWAENFDRELTAENVFEIQSEIAQSIAGALQATLSPEEKAQIGRILTRDLDALAAYTRARNLEQQTTSGDLERAEQEIEFALERDPQFAAAWALMARINTLKYWFNAPDPAYVEAAWQAIQKGRAIQPDLVELDIAEGYYYYHGKYDYDSALTLLERAIQVSPNNAEVHQLMGWITRRAGNWDASLAHLHTAFDLDPRNSLTAVGLADVNENLHRLDKAEEWAEVALALAPTFNYAHYEKAAIDMSRGNFALARETLEPVEATFGAMSFAKWWLALVERDYQAALERADFGEYSETRRGVWPPSMLRGLTLIFSGDSEAGRQSLQAARSDLEARDLAKYGGGPVQMALCITYGGLGLADHALVACERAVAEEQFDAVENPDDRVLIAWGLALAGEKDAALDMIESALRMEARPTRAIVEAEPAFRELRMDPRFSELLDRYHDR